MYSIQARAVTSGGYGHRTSMGLALAYIRSDAIEPGAAYSVPSVGERHTARLLDETPYDSAGWRMRA